MDSGDEMVFDAEVRGHCSVLLQAELQSQSALIQFLCFRMRIVQRLELVLGGDEEILFQMDFCRLGVGSERG